MLGLPLSSLLPGLGWVGAVATICAYAAVSTRRIAPDSRVFQGTNAVGAAMLALSAASSGSWPSTAVNAVWALIGVQAFLVVGWSRRACSTRAPQRADESPAPEPEPVLSGSRATG